MAQEYLLLVQHEIGEASSTEGQDVLRVLLQYGTKVKDGCLSLAQQGVTPRSLQQRLCCLTTFKNRVIVMIIILLATSIFIHKETLIQAHSLVK